MSRGPGWLERAILDLLHLNEYLSSPLLAAKAYAAYSPDKAINPTPAQRAAVWRSLSRLQKRGLVVKLGSMYPGERCYLRRPRARLGYLAQRRATLRIAIAPSLPTARARMYADEIGRDADNVR